MKEIAAMKTEKSDEMPGAVDNIEFPNLIQPNGVSYSLDNYMFVSEAQVPLPALFNDGESKTLLISFASNRQRLAALDIRNNM